MGQHPNLFMHTYVFGVATSPWWKQSERLDSKPSDHGGRYEHGLLTMAEWMIHDGRYEHGLSAMAEWTDDDHLLLANNRGVVVCARCAIEHKKCSMAYIYIIYIIL